MKSKLQISISSLLMLILATVFYNTASAQITYTESFDTTVFLPPGWTPVGSISDWGRVTTGTNPTCVPHSGAAMARFNRTAPPNTLQTFSSPVVDYSNRGSSTPFVSFWIYRDDGAPTLADIITVYVNSTPSLTGAASLGTVARSRVISLPDTQAVNNWYQYSFNIPVGFNSHTNYLMFRGANDTARGNNIFIDDIQWNAFPTPCTGTPTPGTIAASDSVICGGTGSTMLTLTGQTIATGISFQWNSGPSSTGPWTSFGTNQSSISTGTITATTYYYCVLTCSNSSLSDSTPVATVVVDPNPAPSLSLTVSNNGNYCTGVPDTLVASGATTYSWSPSTGLNTTTGNTVLASPAGAPGTTIYYTVTGANAAGCIAKDSIQVTAHSTNTLTIQTTPNDTLCSGQSVTLTAQIGFGPQIISSLWSTGDTTNSITFTPTINGTYTFTIMNNWGCGSSDSVSLVVTTGTVPSISTLTASNNGLYCTGGDSVMLVVSGTSGTMATWSPATGLNSTTGDTVYSVSGGGGFGGNGLVYTVSLTNSGGCAASDTIRVRRGNPPTVNMQVTPGDTICAGDSVTLNPMVFGFGDSFLWTPTGDTSQTLVVAPTLNATYIVQVTSGFSGCTTKDTVNLTVNPAPSAVFTYSISGNTVSFTNNSTNATSYQWLFGDSTVSSQQDPHHAFASSGTFFVTLIAFNGTCTPDTIVHTITINGIIELNGNEEITLLPNPTHGLATIQFNSGNAEMTLQVINSIGEVVQQRTIEMKGNKTVKEEIDMSTLPAGIYMIHANSADRNFTRKLIKQ